MKRALPENQECAVDVAIIGGGPAGCAVAISLAQSGHSVALLERTNYTKARTGETLPPTVQPLLRELGVWERFLADGHAPAPGLVVEWGGTERYETDHIFNPYGCGWNLDRVKFDRSLYLAARELHGVLTFSEVSRLVCERLASRWQLTFSTNHENFDGAENGKPVVLTARFVVAATGRAGLPALLSRQDRFVVDNLIGVIGAGGPLTSEEAVDPRIRIESVRDGWWYSVPLPDGSHIAVYLSDADLVRKQGGVRAAWQNALEQTSGLKSRCGAAVFLKTDLRVVAANSYCRRIVAGEDYILVGDTACAWDPLSGQGVLRALSEGQLAGQAIAAHLRGDAQALKEYEKRVQKNFVAYLRERGDIYRRETRWRSSPFWSRRHELL